MRKRALIGALLVVGLGVVLGATVFRTGIAQATGLVAKPKPVIVSNTPAEAVPVHEQGTANVNLTNKVVAAPAATTRIDLGTFTLANGTGSFSQSPYAVPTGKDLVITGSSGYFAKAFADTTPLDPRYVLLTIDSNESIYVPLQSDSAVFFSWNIQQTAVAHSSVGLAAARDSVTNSAFLHVLLYGYLVDEGSLGASAPQPAQTSVTSPAIDNG